MKIVYPEQLKEHLKNKINTCYIFLGDNIVLINKNQDLIFKYANKQGFDEKVIINIEKNIDWKNVFHFYQQSNLFFKKTILVINFTIKKINSVLIKYIYQTSFQSNSDILVILKINQLPMLYLKDEKLHACGKIIYCFTPYSFLFMNWLKYEIQEKNMKIEKKAIFFLQKNYEGDTLLTDKTLEMLSITWPNVFITIEKIKKIIYDFSIFSPSHWINAILENQKKKALHILNTFYKKQYHSLILIRCLQKDLIILINMKHEKNLNINTFLKNNNIWNIRLRIFKNAFNRISYDAYCQAIQILVKIEIQIKKKYSNAVWLQLKRLTLILC